MADPIWNVTVAVIDLVPAATRDEAIQKMADRLQWAGFDVYEGGDEDLDAFESEPLPVDEEAEARWDWAVVRRLPANHHTPLDV